MIQEEELLEELDDALKRLPEEVSREDVLLFLEAANVDTPQLVCPIADGGRLLTVVGAGNPSSSARAGNQ